MASDILDRVAMVITDTGSPALTAVTANVLISDRFNTPQEAGAVDGKSYWWMLEEGVDYEIFEGTWTLSGMKVARTTVWQSKINGLHGVTKITLGGNATLRSITPAEALNYIRFDGPQALTASQAKQSRSNAGVNDGNVLINSDFRINQRAYVSNAAASGGAYMHDRWKAGSSGATYTFTQLASSTQITITAGTIVQVVEDKNVEGGTYVLSWVGTAQARAGVNSATPSCTFVSSPLVISGQSAGTVMSVEFNAGTLGKAKLESGSTPTPFAMSDIKAETDRAYRYCRPLVMSGGVCATTEVYFNAQHSTMRSAPSVILTGPKTIFDLSANYTQSSAGITISSNSPDGGLYILSNFSGLTSLRIALANISYSLGLLSAEL